MLFSYKHNKPIYLIFKSCKIIRLKILVTGLFTGQTQPGTMQTCFLLPGEQPLVFTWKKPSLGERLPAFITAQSWCPPSSTLCIEYLGNVSNG